MDERPCGVHSGSPRAVDQFWPEAGGKLAAGQDGVLAASNPNFADGDKGSDGKGIEHAEDVFGPAVDRIISGCLPG